jgi:hypothetical protein
MLGVVVFAARNRKKTLLWVTVAGMVLVLVLWGIAALVVWGMG